MLQQKAPEDYVIATGLQHSVRDLVDAAARELGIHLRWKGKGALAKGIDDRGRTIVAVDPRYFRPAEVDSLLGDPTKARRKLGWKPRASFIELVRDMALADLRLAERYLLLKSKGYPQLRRHE